MGSAQGRKELVGRKDRVGKPRIAEFDRCGLLLMRHAADGVLYHRYMVAQLNSLTARRLHACIGQHASQRDVVDTVLPQDLIEISVGESTSTPVLQRDHVAGFSL